MTHLSDQLTKPIAHAQDKFGQLINARCCMTAIDDLFILSVQFLSIDVTEQPEAPTVRTVRTEQTSISLSWEVSKTCSESVDFTVNILWSSASGKGQATNVSGCSYDISGLTPGVSYDITLAAIGDGVRSDPISISATTLSSGEGI